MPGILDGVKIGDWLAICSPLGHFICCVQVTGFTEYGRIIAGHYKFSRDGQRFPNKTRKLIARPANENDFNPPRPQKKSKR